MFRHADARATGTEEDSTLLAGRNLGAFDCVNKAAENNGAGALNIVVEAGVGFAVTGKSGEGVLEVFELDDNTAKLLSVFSWTGQKTVASEKRDGLTLATSLSKLP